MLFNNIDAMMASYASQTPMKAALITANNSYNYDQLYQAARKFAAYLQSEKLQKQCVMLHMPNSIELVIGYLGCFIAGAVAVPLNVSLKPAEIAYIMQLTQPQCLLVSDVKHPHLAPVIGNQSELKLITAAELTSMQPKKIDKLIEKPMLNSPAAVFFTSGSTGRPKGVVHSQTSLLAMMDNMADCVDLSPDDRFLVSEPMSNASGCVHALLTLYANATAIIIASFNTEEYKQIKQQRPTVISVMGKSNHDIVHDVALSADDFASVKFNFSGGEKITKQLMQNFQQKTGVPIRLGYGMSELLLIAINKSLREDKMTSVGKPAKNVQIKLLDAEGKPVALGAMGEVWVQGNNCMIGYWHDAAETAKAIVNGWLRTGDLARCDADGYYWIVGRIKQMIIRGGDNIAPLEVEEVLASHPAVKVAAVIAVPDPIEGEVPKAFVELKAGRTVHENQLLAFLHERLEDYKVPVTIIVLDALPRTPTGKIAREELKKY